MFEANSWIQSPNRATTNPKPITAMLVRTHARNVRSLARSSVSNLPSVKGCLLGRLFMVVDLCSAIYTCLDERLNSSMNLTDIAWCLDLLCCEKARHAYATNVLPAIQSCL